MVTIIGKPFQMNEICVIGFPSRLGGADTELDHQIRVWQALGSKVHLIHTGPLDDNLRAMREEVLHGQTGFLCREPREFVYYSSRAAFEHNERR